MKDERGGVWDRGAKSNAAEEVDNYMVIDE